MNRFVIPIANSAGYAIDQIGMVLEYAREVKKHAPVRFKLCADARFETLVAASATNLNVCVAYPYNRKDFAPGTDINEGPLQMANLRKQPGETILSIEEMVQKLNFVKQKPFALTSSPAGSLFANPAAWIKEDRQSHTLTVRSAADQALRAAGTRSTVRFVFFLGEKSLTDSETTENAKRIGGIAKSINAYDQMRELVKLQYAAAKLDLIIVPVFAQYGDRFALQSQIQGLNETFKPLTPVTNLTAMDEKLDWNEFKGPAHVIASAHRNYGAAVMGSGSALHHLAAAAVPEGTKMPIIVLRPAWSGLRGEERWDAAAKNKRVEIVTADIPRNVSFDEVTKRYEGEPAYVTELIKESSRNVCEKACEGLLDRLVTMTPRGKHRAPRPA